MLSCYVIVVKGDLILFVGRVYVADTTMALNPNCLWVETARSEP